MDKHKILLLLACAARTCLGQGAPNPLSVVTYYNITASSPLDGCDPSYPCIDNRSQFTKQSSTSSYRAVSTGGGNWSVDMQFADGTPTGWTSFGSTAQVNQATPPSGIGYGIGPGNIQKPYHDYIRFVMSGNVIILNYSGTQKFWWLPSVASVSFPITPGQGGEFLTVTAAKPVDLYAHFRDDDTTHMRFAWSRDAVNYAEVNKQGSYTAPPVTYTAGTFVVGTIYTILTLGNTDFTAIGAVSNTVGVSFSATGVGSGTGTASTLPTVRDPSVMYVSNSGLFYVLMTPFIGCQVQLVSSPDLVNFTTLTTINMANYDGSCQTAWAPEWWQDPNNNNTYFWVSVGDIANPTYNSAKTPWVVQMNLTSNLPVSATPITLSGTTQGNTFDYFPYYVAGQPDPYVIVYVDQQNNSTVTQPIAYATSATLTGTYTQQTTPGSDYYGFGTFQTEAPALIPLGAAQAPAGQSGCVRIMIDEWVYPMGNVPPEPIGRVYSQAYRDSCASSGTLFTSGSIVDGPSPINIGKSEHGTVIALNNPATAALVYQAQSISNSDGMYAGNLSINTVNGPFPLTVGVLSGFAAGVTEQQPATIGFGFPSTNAWASLTALHAAAQQEWPPNFLSDTYIAQGYQGTGAFGQFQFINLKTGGTGESSIMLCDGCYQPGQAPVSTEGDKAIWTIGENNQSLDLGSGNHWFGIYNKYIQNGMTTGGFPMNISPITGIPRFAVGIQLGLGLNSLYGHDIYANIDAIGSGGSNQTRINMGNGTPGDASALVELGTVNLKVGLFSALPACGAGVTGRIASVSDSTTNTWGATITGSGGDQVMAFCNGTNWTVAAK